MPDEKAKVRPEDAKRINVNEPYELRDGAKKPGCTEDELRRAVTYVGTSAVEVAEYLKKNGRFLAIGDIFDRSLIA